MTLATVWFCLIGVLWAGYFLLEGFDFGVGILLPWVGRDEEDRNAMLGTIGPVWDGNEVWLVVATGATFAAFPAWYATMFSALYLALLLILVCLIVRVVSFEWRERSASPRARLAWQWANTVGSVGAPFLWGVALANLLHGLPLDDKGVFTGTFLDLFSGYTVLAGLATVLLFALHGATFLTLRTHGDLGARAAAAARRLSVPAVVAVVAFLGWTVAVAVDGNERGVAGPLVPAVVGAVAVVLCAVLVRTRARGVGVRGHRRRRHRDRRDPVHGPLSARARVRPHLRQQPDGDGRGDRALRADRHHGRRRRAASRRPPLPGVDVPRPARAPGRRRLIPTKEPTMSATTDPPEGSPTTTAATTPTRQKAHFGRRAVVWTIIIVASVLGVISILSSWANQQALDTDNWRQTSEEIIQNPKVAPALSAFVVDQLYSNVDLAGELGAQLPPLLKPLAGPAVSALRDPATKNVQKLLARPRFQERFVNASELAHEKFINVVKNETGHGISTGDGVVTLDTTQLINEVGQSLGVPQAVMSKIPANTGVITIMRSDQLGAAQTAVQAIGVLDVWLAPFVILLFALAIYLARGFRRETLRNIGWAFVLVGITVLVLRRIGGNYVVNELVAGAEPSRHARRVAHRDVHPRLDRARGRALRHLRDRRRGARRADAGGHRGPALDGADAELPAGHGVGHRRLPLPAPGAVGADARAAPARVDRHPCGDGRVRRLRAAQGDAA